MGLYRSLTPIKNAVAFHPSLLTGKMLLYIMDAANVTLSGSDVTGVTDLSGNGYDGVTGASKPTFNATGLNGQGVIEMAPNATTPYLAFAGGVNFLEAARGTSVYMVHKHRSLGGDNVFLTLKFNGSNNYPCLEIYNGNSDYQFTGDNAKIPQKTRWLNINPGTSNWHTACLTNNGAGYGTFSNTNLYFDKVLQTPTVSTYQQWGNSNVVGTYAAGAGAGFSAPVNLAFLLIVDHELSSTERTNLDAWVLTKYGI